MPSNNNGIKMFNMSKICEVFRNGCELYNQFESSNGFEEW